MHCFVRVRVSIHAFVCLHRGIEARTRCWLLLLVLLLLLLVVVVLLLLLLPVTVVTQHVDKLHMNNTLC